MNLKYFPLIGSSEWLVEEKKCEPSKQALQESIFTLGNGYIGSRGIAEEIPSGATPGTYFAGLYDVKNTQVTEMVNAPNPIRFRVNADGQDLDISSLRVQSHYRALDMRQGILYRNTVFTGKGRKRYRLESARFFHIEEKHLAAIRVCLTPLDSAASFGVSSYVDDQVTNKGIMTEGDKMHFITKEKSRAGQVQYLSDVTFEHGYILAFATHTRIRKGKREWTGPQEQFSVKAAKNQTVCITKIIAINSTRDKGISEKNIKEKTLGLVRTAARKGYDTVLNNHLRGWDARWKASDIHLECGGEPQRALRFNIYHLLILANPAEEQASIGARVLSAEDYKGHVFWDTELFMLPFFIYTDPPAARSFLMYRYNRLDPARKIAARRGYEGAQFPWESADAGVEVTPRFTVDLDGRIVQTIIGEEEHIVCDIGYATWHYYFATRDRSFMLKYGLELLLETARFWVSRGTYNTRTRSYHINGVMGCDEFHANTNNNAFTNGLARFTILAAVACLEEFEKTSPTQVKALLSRIGLKRVAVNRWKPVAQAIKRPPVRKDSVIEEFDGFFKHRYFRLPKRKKYFLPGLPEKHVSVKDLRTTQYVKQGDTLILLYLLSEEFDSATKKANFAYYDARTLHMSSLSPSTYAIMGAEVGDLTKAYNYFLACLYTDIHNLYNNTARGIHGASLGATWQVVVNGFTGMRIYFNGLSFKPSIPRQIKGVRFTVGWRGSDLLVHARNDRMVFRYDGSAGKAGTVRVGECVVPLRGGREISVVKTRRDGWQIEK